MAIAGWRLEDADTGDNNRTVGVESWPVPAVVALDGDNVTWFLNDHDAGIGVRTAAAPPDLLERFLRLAHGPSERVAAFVDRYGLFSIPADEDGFWLESGSEPVAVWRTIANDVGAAVDVAAKLRQGKRPDVSDWSRFQTMDVELVGDGPWLHAFFHDVGPLRWGIEELFGEDEAMIAAFVNAWPIEGRLIFNWELRGHPVLKMHAGLAGALGMALADAVRGGKGMAWCKWCGDPFVPPRQKGRRVQCDTCVQTNRSQREAEKASRRRRAERGAKGGATADES